MEDYISINEARRRERRELLTTAIGTAAVLVMLLIGAWLFCVATPPQNSAINDLEEVVD